MNIVLLLLASYGICFGLINKLKFLRKLSFFDSMLECVYCTGFHTGWITYLLMGLAVKSFEFDFAQLAMFAFGSSTFCYTLDTFIIYLEHRTAKLKEERSNSNLFG